jgi:hypothetical protein
MTFESKSIPSQGFPNPVEQAAVILEVCGDDFCEARAIVTTNLRFARTQGDILYWSGVERALVFDENQTEGPRGQTDTKVPRGRNASA